jgi:hypothetical protein
LCGSRRSGEEKSRQEKAQDNGYMRKERREKNCRRRRARRENDSYSFWDISHPVCRKATDVSEEHVTSILSSDRYLFHAVYLLGLFFDDNDIGDMSL